MNRSCVISAQAAGPATVAKLNVDDVARLAARLGVQSIPTVVLFNNGKVVHQFVGNDSSAALVQAVEMLLQDLPRKGRP